MSALLNGLSVSGNWVWPVGRTPLLVTNHGSHLYGTATASSDKDIYCVVTSLPKVRSTWTHKRQENGVDITMIDFGTWMAECVKGVPQALEAMFAPEPDLDRIVGLRSGYHVGTEVWGTYLRTIKAFAHADPEDPRARKRKVHALRLAWNLRQIRGTGRFDPVLHPLQVDQYRRVVETLLEDGEGLYNLALQVAWG